VNDLIKALQIFLKYSDPYAPTHCEHDVMYVNVNPAKVSDEDKAALDELGFTPDSNGMFRSFRFGSC